MKLNSISIRRRMVYMVGAFASVVGIIGLLSIIQMFKINQTLDSVFEVTIPGIDLVIEADRDLQQLLVAERSLLQTEPGSDAAKAFIEEYNKNLEQSETRIGDYKKVAVTDKEKEILGAYDKVRDEWKAVSASVLTAIASGDKATATTTTMGESKEKFEAMREHLNSITDINLASVETLEKKSHVLFIIIVITFVTLLLTVIVAGVLMALKVSRSITDPIESLVKVGKQIEVGDLPSEQLPIHGTDEIAELTEIFNSVVSNLKEKAQELSQIASGDLAITVNYLSEKDQFAQVFDTMLNSLNDSLSQVKTATEKVHLGSSQISQTSSNLAEGASLQAATLEEISASLAEISSQAEENTRNSDEARTKVADSKKLATEGNDLINQVVDAMDQIKSSAGSIKGIVKAIDDIAFQTNLLALNAAVEAARAGQHGKGFAVVADEVRNLAQRSAKSAQTTTEKVEEALASIEQGHILVQKTADQFSLIVSDTDGIATIVGDIAQSSRVQASRLDAAKGSLAQIDSVTQGNAASAEENASTSDELMNQAAVLNAMVANFKLAGEPAPQLQRSSRAQNHTRPAATLELPRERSAQPKLANYAKPSRVTEHASGISDDEYGNY